MVIPQIINLTTKMKKRHIYTVMNTPSPCTNKRNVQENQKKNKRQNCQKTTELSKTRLTSSVSRDSKWHECVLKN